MCHVLVIEDEPLIATMLQDCLVAEGATSVDIAASEGDAVDAAKARRPDFITFDVRLVEGTGPNAVIAIKQIYGEIPVLFITGSPHECIGWPPDTVLQKPARLAEVSRRFRKVTT